MEWCSIDDIKSIDIGLMIDQKRLDLFQRALRDCTYHLKIDWFVASIIKSIDIGLMIDQKLDALMMAID